MKYTIRPEARVALAVVILLVLVVLPVYGVASFAFGLWFGNSEQITTARAALHRFDKINSERPVLETRKQELKALQAGQVGLWQGSNASIAGTALQADFRRLVEAHQGELRNSQPNAQTSEFGLEQIEQSFDVILPTDALPNFLTDVETHSPFLLIKRIEITALETLQPAIAKLSIRIRVAGYRRVS